MTIRKKLLTTLALVVAAASITTVWVIVRGTGSDAPPGPPLADVYAGMVDALARRGMIAHVRFETKQSNPSNIGEQEAWIDSPADVARVQVTRTYLSHAIPATASVTPPRLLRSSARIQLARHARISAHLRAARIGGRAPNGNANPHPRPERTGASQHDATTKGDLHARRLALPWRG